VPLKHASRLQLPQIRAAHPPQLPAAEQPKPAYPWQDRQTAAEERARQRAAAEDFPEDLWKPVAQETKRHVPPPPPAAPVSHGAAPVRPSHDADNAHDNALTTVPLRGHVRLKFAPPQEYIVEEALSVEPQAQRVRMAVEQVDVEALLANEIRAASDHMKPAEANGQTSHPPHGSMGLSRRVGGSRASRVNQS
jgi:hypothetical protein